MGGCPRWLAAPLLCVRVLQGEVLAPAVQTAANRFGLREWSEALGSTSERAPLANHKWVARYVSGPVLVGDAEQRAVYAASGKLPKGARLLPTLGAVKLT